jgi:poly(3-hydroxybutyrate) depolymerase
VNRCGSGPDFETVQETPPSPDRPGWLGLTRHIITGGVGGTKVATLTVHGGGHAWPGSAWQARRNPGASRAEIERQTLAYMATMPAWRDHPRVTSGAG